MATYTPKTRRDDEVMASCWQKADGTFEDVYTVHMMVDGVSSLKHYQVDGTEVPTGEIVTPGRCDDSKEPARKTDVFDLVGAATFTPPQNTVANITVTVLEGPVQVVTNESGTAISNLPTGVSLTWNGAEFTGLDVQGFSVVGGSPTARAIIHWETLQ